VHRDGEMAVQHIRMAGMARKEAQRRKPQHAECAAECRKIIMEASSNTPHHRRRIRRPRQDEAHITLAVLSECEPIAERLDARRPQSRLGCLNLPTPPITWLSLTLAAIRMCRRITCWRFSGPSMPTSPYTLFSSIRRRHGPASASKTVDERHNRQVVRRDRARRSPPPRVSRVPGRKYYPRTVCFGDDLAGKGRDEPA
jgi:hypothetical protein